MSSGSELVAVRPQTRRRWLSAVAVGAVMGQPAAGYAAALIVPPVPARTPDPFTGAELALGSAAAPITVIEYLSVTCSHCAAFDRDTWPDVDRDFVEPGRVRFIIKEMPTAPVAVASAGFLLARCAGQARYWPIVRALLKEQTVVLSAPTLTAAVEREAQIAGFDRDAAEFCLSDQRAIDAINARRQDGLSLGVDSTPFFIVDGRPLRPGMKLAGVVYEGGELNLAQFKAAIASAAGRR